MVPPAALVIRLNLLVGVVESFSSSGALRRGGGKLSRSAAAFASVYGARSSRSCASLVPISRCMCPGPVSTSSTASNRSATVEYCMDSRLCSCRSRLSEMTAPPLGAGECSSAATSRLRRW